MDNRALEGLLNGQVARADIDFVDGRGATLFPEEVPRDEWKTKRVFDAAARPTAPARH